MLALPEISVPIQFITVIGGAELWLKREDLIHPKISGNKFWKLYYNINDYLEKSPQKPLLITFGGAFSNHISAVSYLGKEMQIPTLGIIRGEELQHCWHQNPTLYNAAENGMELRFVSRSVYRRKDVMTCDLQSEFPEALVIPEGGTNQLAVEGFRHVLNLDTAHFDYICTAVGTGGTLAGLSKFAENHQKIIGFAVVNDDRLQSTVHSFSARLNFKILDAAFGGYGKLAEDVNAFINYFHRTYGIPLDPVYTGKMMFSLMKMMDEGRFQNKEKILAVHTGGLQGIAGANWLLNKHNKELINF